MKRILCIDVETTGLDPSSCAIVEIAFCTVSEKAIPTMDDADVTFYRCRPPHPIPPEATEVHGITDADVADAPSFLGHPLAGALMLAVDNADAVLGYNVSFDVSFLAAELRRGGLRPLADRVLALPQIDPLMIWRQREPMTLEGAVRRFVREEMDAAHSASVDLAYTMLVAAKQVFEFGIEPTVDALALAGNPTRALWIGPTDHIQWADETRQRVVFGFGKHRGRPLTSHPDYCAWVAGPKAGFPEHARKIAAMAAHTTHDALATALREREDEGRTL